MTELQTLRLMKKMVKYLKHRDGCCEGPDYFIDAKKLESCPSGLQDLRCLILDKIHALMVQSEGTTIVG